MIHYPLELPAVPGFRTLTLGMRNVGGVNESPFSLQQQTYEFPGEGWMAEVSYPPITSRDLAAPLQAFLAMTRGQAGTFLLGDLCSRFPRGAALGSPLIPGTGLISAAASKTLRLAGFELDVPQILLPGDYIEIGRNFLSDPSVFSDWVAGGTPIVDQDAETSPDGTVTADEISLGEDDSVSQIVEAPIMARGTRIAFRIWLKGAVTSPSEPVAFLLSLKRALGTSPETYQLFGDAQVAMVTDDAWGYYEVIAELDADTTAILAELKNDEAGEKVVYAWGASLDDALTRRRLHMVMKDADSDADGFSTLDIWPRLREVPDEYAPINLTNCRGTFRMASNQREFSINEAKVYGFAFKCVEAIT